MIIDKVKKGSITIYTVDYTDEKLVSVMNKKLNRIKDIIDHDADVFINSYHNTILNEIF